MALTAAKAAILVASFFSWRPVNANDCTVYTFNEHGEAIRAWSDARRSGELGLPSASASATSASDTKRTGATLVHFDSHADMGLPPYFDGNKSEMSGLELAQNVDLATFILPAILAGLVRDVIWVMPEWGMESDYGEYEFFVAEDVAAGSFRTDAPFVATTTDPSEADTFDNVHWVKLSVVPFTEEALSDLSLDLAEPFIVDVDLDVVSTENPGAVVLRRDAGLSVTDVERFVQCSCSEEVECDMELVGGVADVPKMYAKAVGSLPERSLHHVKNDICRAPVHYSTEEEIMDGVDLILRWVESLGKRGLKAGTATVAESSDGYLPPGAFEHVRLFASRLTQSLGCSSLQRMDCSNCVRLEIHNDHDTGIDMYSVDGYDQSVSYFDHLPPNSESVHDLYSKQEFKFTSLDGHQYTFRLPTGIQNQTVTTSAMEQLENPEVHLEIVNDLDDEVQLFWVDGSDGGDWFSAPLEFVEKISPGDSVGQSSYAGHYYILKSALRSGPLYLRVPLERSEHQIAVSQLEDASDVSIPIEVVFHNDVDTYLDVFWAPEDGSSTSSSQGRIVSGESLSLTTHSGHVFLFENVEEEVHLSFRVPFESEEQSIYLSEIGGVPISTRKGEL